MKSAKLEATSCVDRVKNCKYRNDMALNQSNGNLKGVIRDH